MVSGCVLFFGVSDKVRECVVKEFTLPTDQVRVLRGNFEEVVKKFEGGIAADVGNVRGEEAGGCWPQGEEA